MNITGLIGELTFKFSRSGGAGGQHVNKVSSKVTLQWDVERSAVFSAEEKALVAEKLSNRINKEGILQLESDTDRSQVRNKEIAIDRFLHLVKDALVPSKPRKKTKIPYSSVLKRLDRKKQQSQLKASRRRSFDD
ncbi:MAG: aminoacyl-tRNA hydrolase [Sphingobacterium sp.]|jgi:ribosome-associated protein|uniref:alternative ribosome rescue aminoacyl-tRNA hydrolase ArfB n=1 Tax=Sphingobacterium sp. CZ-UAM TaxID=1933868 RepID=UPI000987C80D|nr:alternative ribosome rescue aminoacyl-tRNA hydrolase ArfB [Sphingobacterium sp. CZ-UAM]MDF2518468.1 aminoacyl-tRNA hydrolase [Sphingobacterium sp.]OOG16733.1 aminoacyl-tRNA hydrolase [Sphingobacterium sp. CZ-UAM]